MENDYASPDGAAKKEELADLLADKKRGFIIAGMGGSAGSLEAIQHFLQKVPANSGIAFVLIQHLDPATDSLLPGLLQTFTKLPVVEVQDGLKVQPNHIYVIPKNKEMAIMNGTLLLMEFSKPAGFRMPIDTFLQSLAEDWGDKSACVIFSGMGSDGELGARFIKKAFGLVLIQEPSTALYDSMPRSAIHTGLPTI
jgi:two-component system CheB/CheR fusion protein